MLLTLSVRFFATRKKSILDFTFKDFDSYVTYVIWDAELFEYLLNQTFPWSWRRDYCNLSASKVYPLFCLF